MQTRADARTPSSIDELVILAASDCYSAASSGGAERAAREMYRRWGAAGADITVVSVPGGQPYADPGVNVEVLPGIDLSRVVGGHFVIAPGAFRSVTRLARELRPHVIHVNTLHYTSCIAAATLARRLRLPLVTTVQLGSADRLPLVSRTSLRVYDATVGRFILRRSDRILCVSQSVKKHVQSMGIRGDRVAVVENGVDHQRFGTGPIRITETPLILVVGRLMANKGPELVVEAAQLLKQRSLSFRVVFLGDGPLRSRIERRIAELGLSCEVELKGQVTDVERWLDSSEIVVRPSYTEGLPLAVLEGMAAGRCNVVSDIPPNKELINDGVNGRTFASGSAADLARVLSEVLIDVDGRRALAERARRDSLTRSWDRMANETAQALIDAIGSQRGV